MAIIIYITCIYALPLHRTNRVPSCLIFVLSHLPIHLWLTIPFIFTFFLFSLQNPKLILLLFVFFFLFFYLESNAENCSISISPVLSLTSLNISSTSASVNFSPMEVNTCFNSAAEINPSPFLSKTLNASSNSC